MTRDTYGWRERVQVESRLLSTEPNDRQRGKHGEISGDSGLQEQGDGAVSLKEGGSSRRAEVKHAIEALGGKMEAFYFAYGHVDAYVICRYSRSD